MRQHNPSQNANRGTFCTPLEIQTFGGKNAGEKLY
jgi:hypothetical protein